MLLKARWRCRSCGKAGRMEVDHVVPVQRGGSDAMENLQALCRSCHIRKTRRENRRELSPDEVRWRELLAATLARR